MAFGGFLKQSTAVDILLGPFSDSTDAVTPETSLSIAQADVLLSKNGQTMTQKNDNTTCVHDANGYYNCELNATDTNTCGQLTVTVLESGSLPIRLDFQVVEEIVSSELFDASATGVNAACDTAISDYDPPTKAEMDTAHALLATVAALSTHDGKLDTVDTVVDGIQTDLDNATDGLGALKALIDTAQGNITDILADTNELQSDDYPTTLAAILEDVTGINGDVMRGTDAAALASVCTEGRLAELDSGNLPTDVAGIPAATWATAMSDLSSVPTATASALQALNWLFEIARNKIESTSSEISIYKDDGSTKLAESDISDDDTTFTRGEFGVPD